jgi:hypothetical protein
MTIRNLKRAIGAWRYGPVWNQALDLLTEAAAVRIEKRHKANVIVLLKAAPARVVVDRPKRKTGRHRPRSQGRSEWFENLLTERDH